MPKRSSSSPKRRIVDLGSVPPEQLQAFAGQARYVGSGHHKRSPADYGFERTNPRPTKSLCDALRVITLREAQELLWNGILMEMISLPPHGELPKFVWSVSQKGEVFEAKTHPNTPGMYHGYPLENEDDMRDYVLTIWKERCTKPGK